MSKTYKQPKKLDEDDYKERFSRKLDKKKRDKELREKRKHSHELID